jgi:hypothetical protein
VRVLGVEGHAHRGAGRRGAEHDLRRAVAERVGDALVLDDVGVDAGEVEARAAVPRLHARRERAAGAQVDGGRGGVPVVEAAFHRVIASGEV